MKLSPHTQRQLALFSLCIVAVLSQACGLIINGQKQKISINSSPNGAAVHQFSAVQCHTPCILNVERDEEPRLTVKKTGYQDHQLRFMKKKTMVPIVLDVLFFIPGLVVDLAMGTLDELQPNEVFVKLKPSDGSAPLASQSTQANDIRSKGSGAMASIQGAVSAKDLRGITLQKIAVPALNISIEEKSIGGVLTEIMTTEASRTPGLTIISSSDISATLGFEKQQELLGCTDDLACMAEIGGALGVDAILVGNLGKIGNAYVLTMKLIDTNNVKVLARTYNKVKGEADQVIDLMQVVVKNLFDSIAKAKQQS